MERERERERERETLLGNDEKRGAKGSMRARVRVRWLLSVLKAPCPALGGAYVCTYAPHRRVDVLVWASVTVPPCLCVSKRVSSCSRTKTESLV